MMECGEADPSSRESVNRSTSTPTIPNTANYTYYIHCIYFTYNTSYTMPNTPNYTYYIEFQLL